MDYKKNMYDLIVIGGGAGGVFAAINFKEKFPESKVLILEKSSTLLAKLRLTGGGRCNLTNAEFDPKNLVHNYPRGFKELIGPFYKFGSKDTINWFESRSIALKIEDGGKVFPVSDRSQTIIDCFLTEIKKFKIEIIFEIELENISKNNNFFEINHKNQKIFAKNLILATGSNLIGYELARRFGHTIQTPIPSLFTFNIANSYLKDLSGIVQAPVEVKIKETSFSQTGSLLITHFGFSGPVILSLSAFAAKYLNEKNYKSEIFINWLADIAKEAVLKRLFDLKNNYPNNFLHSSNIFNFSKNLWYLFLDNASLNFRKKIKDISKNNIINLAKKLTKDVFVIDGKGINKSEFVTCGGVTLSEVNFKSMQSKICPNLYFVGEILDIDGVTGGYNLQNAWTSAYIAASSI